MSTPQGSCNELNETKHVEVNHILSGSLTSDTGHCGPLVVKSALLPAEDESVLLLYCPLLVPLMHFFPGWLTQAGGQLEESPHLPAPRIFAFAVSSALKTTLVISRAL